MSEVIINDDGGEDVLAEAAVASTAMAGAALASSQHATADAEEAEATANGAVELAMAAHEELQEKPTYDDVSDMVHTSVNDAFNRLADLLSSRLAPAAAEVIEEPKVDVIEEVPEEVAPKSVEKAKKTHRSFRDRYLGLE
jgi:hypothetical protein